MTSPKKRVVVAVAVAWAAAALLTACAPEPDAVDSPPPSSPPASDPVSSPSPEPSSTTASAFTDEELAQTCIDVTLSVFPDDVIFDKAAVRVEKRTVDPEWLVLVPARIGDTVAEAQCTIGGTPAAPVIGLSSGSVQPLPEEQIQRLIVGENEGGTE